MKRNEISGETGDAQLAGSIRYLIWISFRGFGDNCIRYFFGSSENVSKWEVFTRCRDCGFKGGSVPLRGFVETPINALPSHVPVRCYSRSSHFLPPSPRSVAILPDASFGNWTGTSHSKPGTNHRKTRTCSSETALASVSVRV
jgi:hypothetical protein